jgi:hypothetical protein
LPNMAHYDFLYVTDYHLDFTNTKMPSTLLLGWSNA